MPFLADEFYRNLVLSVDPDAQESVHLATWPEPDRALIDEQLNGEMRRVLLWASLGHAARNKANRKVRQPLAEAAFAVSSAEDRRILEKYGDLLADELNVKKIRPLDAAGEVVAYTLNPLPKALGPKHGALFPKVRSALMALDSEAAASLLLSGKSVSVKVDDAEVEAGPEEVEVRMTAREGIRRRLGRGRPGGADHRAHAGPRPRRPGARIRPPGAGPAQDGGPADLGPDPRLLHRDAETRRSRAAARRLHPIGNPGGGTDRRGGPPGRAFRRG